MHIDLGFPDPLVDCLQLQCALHGITRTQGSPGSSRLPITDYHMLVIYQSLSFTNHDHVMFWAASTLAYFGFLRSSEFTVSPLSTFNPFIHLLVSNIAMDSHTSPSCLQIGIKASKTDPFWKGCHVYIGMGHPPLCALSAFVQYLLLRGQSPGPLFLLSSGQPLSRALLTRWLKDTFTASGIPGSASGLVLQLLLLTLTILIILFRPWGRWNSDAYKLYIRTPAEALTQATSLLSQWLWLLVSSLCQFCYLVRSRLRSTPCDLIFCSCNLRALANKMTMKLLPHRSASLSYSSGNWLL